MGNPNTMQVEGFFDSRTSTVSYLEVDRSTMQCALIDSVLDYDPKAGRTHTASADKLVARVRDLGVRVVWFLVLLVHADHLSAAPYLKEKLGGRLGIGKDIVTVQNVFGKLFNAGAEFARDGSQFDHLFSDGEAFSIGSLKAKAMHTPGHTPACMTYVISDENKTDNTQHQTQHAGADSAFVSGRRARGPRAGGRGGRPGRRGEAGQRGGK